MDKLNSKKGPNFIGVGPEKTGTSWMNSQLRAHPDVSMPPIDELRYFWERQAFPGEGGIRRLASSKSWHRIQYRKYMRARLRGIVRNPYRAMVINRGRFAWDLGYLFRKHDNDWYLNCFDRLTAPVTGEISPQYFFMPQPGINRVSSLLPDVKVIVTLRRPLDWVWSFASMNFNNGLLQRDYGTVEAFIEAKIERCSFSRSLLNWRQSFDEGRVLVMFYENLKSDPWAYYKQICDFIGINPDPDRKSHVCNRVNAGKKDPIPDQYRETIRSGWAEDITALSKLVPELPESWLE